MVATSDFTKRVPPGSARRGTLAELMSRQKELASRQAEFGTVQPIQSWTQGLAQMGGALATGLQQRQAANDEHAARSRLAELRAGINQDTGATAQQIAELGMIDENVAETYRQEAAQARQDQKKRDFDIANREDEQSFRAGESTLERDARLKTEADQNALTKRGQDIDVTQGETTAAETHRSNVAGEAGQAATLAETTARDQANQNMENAKLNETIRANNIAANKPLEPIGEIYHSYLSGQLGGQPGDPVAEKNLADRIAKLNAPDKGTTITVGGESADLRKEYYKTVGQKTFPQYQTEAVKAGNMTRAMELLGDIDPTVQGPLVGRLAQMFPGVSDNAALFSSIVKELAPQARVEGSGSTSDIEYQGMVDSLPQLMNNPEANALIREAIKARSAISMERGRLVNEWRSGRMSEDAVFDSLAKLDSQSIYSNAPRLKEMVDAAAKNRPISLSGDDGAGAGAAQTGVVSPGDPLLDKYK